MRTKIQTIDLYLRPHTAKILRHHCEATPEGILKVNDSKIVGSLVWSNVQRVELPVAPDYGDELVVCVPLRLACKYKRGNDWRYAFWHIDRPSMARIDKWVHDLFTYTVFVHYAAVKSGKAQSIRYWMDHYKLTDDDIKYDTLYMDIRRKESECSRKIGEVYVPKMPSFA